MAIDDDILAIARAAIAEFGTGAPSVMDARARAHEEAQELDTARFWRSVADAARKILRDGSLH